MPTEAELVASVPSWQPDPDRALLLIHDMQRYFVDRFPRDASPRVELVANIERIRCLASRTGIPVVYTVHAGQVSAQRRGLLTDFWGPGMSADPRVCQILPEVGPEPGDTVVERRRYSAFYDSALAEVFAAHGRDQVIVCGVYARIGCLLTACDAFSRDIQPFLVADAVADFTARDHRMALEYAARTCAVTLTTRQLLAALCPERAGTPRLVAALAGQLLDDAGQLDP
jgi:bifunctional isochorismate lyase/aryl carrier protein